MKNNKMPGMPSLVSDGAEALLSPESEVSIGSDASDLAESLLEAPVHKPTLISAENKSVSTVKASAPKKGLEVVALRKGFYNQHRLREGDSFTIKSFEDLGDWMKCVDPDLQKKHLENLKYKKAIK